MLFLARVFTELNIKRQYPVLVLKGFALSVTVILVKMESVSRVQILV